MHGICIIENLEPAKLAQNRTKQSKPPLLHLTFIIIIIINFHYYYWWWRLVIKTSNRDKCLILSYHLILIIQTIEKQSPFVKKGTLKLDNIIFISYIKDHVL